MANDVKGMKVAVLATTGFEQIELTSPVGALNDAGVETKIVSLKSGSIRGYNHEKPGDPFEVDLALDEAKADDFEALLLPGGIINPDQLRGDESALTFVRDFFMQGKPVFAICHGPQVLISAGVVKGRKLTSYATVRIDLENAGAEWKDESVVVDEGLVTSRNPDDLEDFNAKILETLAQGVHAGQSV